MNLLRKMSALLALTGLISVALVVPTTEAQATPYTSYTFLDKPHKSNIVPTGINSSGQIVGTYMDSHFAQHGFLLSHGAYTKLEAPGAVPGSTAPAGINEFGDIVGTYVDSVNYGNHGFLLSYGVYTQLDVNLPTAIAYPTTFADGINDWGQIVGTYQGTDGRTHGFLFYNGVYTSFDVHSAASTVTVNATLPASINDWGQIAGQYTTYTTVNGVQDNFDTHGFVLSGSTTTTLDYPGALNNTYGAGTQAYGINALGQVVGSYVDMAGTTHGFVWSCGAYTVFNAPNAANTYGSGINALGQIVGYYDDGNYDGTNLHGFVLNP